MKNTKLGRIITAVLLVAFCMAQFMIPVSVSAAQDFTLAFDTVNALSTLGGTTTTISVPLKMTAFPAGATGTGGAGPVSSLGAFKLDVTFNQAKLIYDSVELNASLPTSLSPGGEVNATNAGSGSITISWAAASGGTTETTLLTVKFKLASGITKGDYAVGIANASGADQNGTKFNNAKYAAAITESFTNGAIKVTNPAPTAITISGEKGGNTAVASGDEVADSVNDLTLSVSGVTPSGAETDVAWSVVSENGVVNAGAGKTTIDGDGIVAFGADIKATGGKVTFKATTEAPGSTTNATFDVYVTPYVITTATPSVASVPIIPVTDTWNSVKAKIENVISATVVSTYAKSGTTAGTVAANNISWTITKPAKIQVADSAPIPYAELAEAAADGAITATGTFAAPAGYQQPSTAKTVTVTLAPALGDATVIDVETLEDIVVEVGDTNIFAALSTVEATVKIDGTAIEFNLDLPVTWAAFDTSAPKTATVTANYDTLDGDWPSYVKGLTLKPSVTVHVNYPTAGKDFVLNDGKYQLPLSTTNIEVAATVAEPVAGKFVVFTYYSGGLTGTAVAYRKAASAAEVTIIKDVGVSYDTIKVDVVNVDVSTASATDGGINILANPLYLK